MIISNIRSGFINKFDIATNGQEAIDLVSSNPPYKIIFMDCNMPIKNGYEASKEILQIYKERLVMTLPLICACTGHTEPMFLKKARENGMCMMVKKPVEIEQIKEVLSIVELNEVK